VKNFILIGDIHKSIYFLSWKENGSQLTLLAKDFSSLNCFSIEFLIDESTLSLMVFDDQKNVQLENAVSTISQEYLLEFTFEYGIPKSLHPNLPGLKDPIVEFRKGKVGVYTKFFEFVNFCIPILQFLFDILGHYQIHLSQFRVIDMGDTVVASGSSGTPAAIEKSPLDFSDEDPPPVITERGDEVTAKAILESGSEKEAAAMGPVMNKRRRKRGNKGAKANAPPKVLRKDHVASREERIKAAFKEFKKYNDDRVTSQYAEMNTRLDALSIDFDEELYPHMLIAITGRRWVIGHGLRLAVIKCAESTELRQVFADVVSAGVAKGMSEGLKHRVEHGKAKVDLVAIEAYDPEADTKYVAALHALKDLEYPLVDQLEKLKDAPIDVIMASLFFESDSGEAAPQGICELRPSSSQLKIPVFPKVRNPKDAWSLKEEIQLKDVIAANISRAEEKKKCRVVYRTYRVGFAHHARSDSVPVSVPTVAPQGLAILLADAATQTYRTEDEASSRLLRSKSVPPMSNLD
nr:cleavage and polyadenylation specificity factor subunit 1 [Tanacetum cinerariifolium]